MTARQEAPIIRTNGNRPIGFDVVKGAVDRIEAGNPALLKSHWLAQIEPDQIGDRHDRIQTEEE